MRVPAGTPIDQAFQTGIAHDGAEHLGQWVTSKGDRLTPLDVYTSARKIGPRSMHSFHSDAGIGQPMIESRYWKEELRRIAASIRRVAKPPMV